MINELRIGNWICDYIVDPEKTIYYKVEQIIEKAGNLGVCYRNGSAWSLIPEPIPLTEEILLKCGFEKHPHIKSTFYIMAGLGAIFIDDHSILLNKVRIPLIKYLHQIQNIYHLIQGEELNIEL